MLRMLTSSLRVRRAYGVVGANLAALTVAGNLVGWCPRGYAESRWRKVGDPV